MSETKIQIQQRKIKNGIRKEQAARKKAMWKKLSTVDTDFHVQGSFSIERTVVVAESRKLNARWTAGWDSVSDLEFDKAIINEWVTKNDKGIV